VLGVADFTVEALGDGWYLVGDDTSRWRVAVAGTGDTRWIFADGQVAQLSIADPDSITGPSKSHGESGVMAPMPATVVTVNVTAGQSVTRGDTLLVLEAMKMELPIRAPHDGVIAAVHCAKGELVQPGINLLEFQ
jgi:3-methylcrotonyl-CoA carboxylase alpha subunit